MLIRIEGSELPGLSCGPSPDTPEGHQNVHVPGRRFIYLSWGVVEAPGSFTMFRRAKLWLDAVPDEVVTAAIAANSLVGRLGLTDDGGRPLCASVRPPQIEWSAGTE